MKKPVFLNIEGIGRVFFKRNTRSKNVNIRVRPEKGVLVTMPVWLSYAEATRILEKNLNWVREQKKKMEEWVMENVAGPDVPFEIEREDIKAWLTGRVERAAERYGFDYGRISVREQATRWGSCSSKNNISLNAKLAWLPDELVDYVIIHELMHTRIKDHSGNFWRAMDEVFGDAKAVDRRLRDYYPEFM
jgi:hypothetical protein